MYIDHLGFAVKDINEGIAYWLEVFEYKQITEVVHNALQKVKVVFLCKDNSVTIKLIEPLESNLALKKFVDGGGGFHHLCFKCHDIDEKMKELTNHGFITLVAPQPGEAFNNHNIAFLLGKYRMNIELIETNEKAKMLPLDPEYGD